MKKNLTLLFAGVLGLLAACSAPESELTPDKAIELTPDEAREIAKEAYIYANPVVDLYRVMYTYFVDKDGSEYKAPWNQLKNIARVYTSDDRAIQTPNSDTPYSFIGFDLRSEPMVLIVPEIEEGRYFSIQLNDLYTHIFDYIGTRATGNGGGTFLIAGPNWKGNEPDGITKVIHSETEFAMAGYRTQLFNAEDLKNVKKIQAGYKAMPLSEYLGEPAAEAAASIDFVKPLTADGIKKSPEVFSQLNFVLQFCPPHKSEAELMKRFAKLNIGAGKKFKFSDFTPEIQQAIGQGIGDAWAEFMALKDRASQGEVGSAEIFGSREHLQNNYLYRMTASVLGLLGNAAAEALYPSYYVDADGQKLDGANNYTIYFAEGHLPPVKAFWSMTMYEQPSSLMVANPINRYLINSPMLSQFKRDASGGITIYVQNKSPGKDKESNWLPAPDGPFSVVARLYWPDEEALDGSWKQPPMLKVE